MGFSSFEFGFAFGAIVRRLMGQGFGCFKRRSIEMLLRYIISEVRDPRDRTLKITYYKGFSLPLFSADFTCGSIEAILTRGSLRRNRWRRFPQVLLAAPLKHRRCGGDACG